MTSLLDNPIWHSLRTRHAALGRQAALANVYAPQVAPFAGVAAADAQSGEALAGLLGDDEPYYLVGVIPPAVPGWRLDDHGVITQMICAAVPAVPDGPAITPLGEAHVADMLELTTLVFPGYFRAATLRMGHYIGIYEDGRLAAMAGERMDLPGYREISAVCTHPDHAGRGHAQRLVALVTRQVLAAGLTPFLHVSPGNGRAKRVYERLGYTDRCDVALYSLHREAAAGA
jgi:ribosomal protein S18 acetylase RimI-like enzyme